MWAAKGAGEGAGGPTGGPTDGPLWVEVSTGKTDGLMTVITNGIEAGDVVVLSGVDKAEGRAGMKDKSRFLLYQSRQKK